MLKLGKIDRITFQLGTSRSKNCSDISMVETDFQHDYRPLQDES